MSSRHWRVALHQQASHTVLSLIRELNQGDRGRETQNKRQARRWRWNRHVPAVHRVVWLSAKTAEVLKKTTLCNAGTQKVVLGTSEK